MLKYIPQWIKGGIIADLYVATIYALKLTCVDASLCFVEPFVGPTFFPLSALSLFLTPEQTVLLGTHIILTLFAVWFIIGAIIGLLWSLFFSKKESPEKPTQEAFTE